LPLDFPRYRHAVRILAEPNYREHDQQLKFTEIVFSGHFFDYTEEMVASYRKLSHGEPFQPP
jgi:hypothetical protein